MSNFERNTEVKETLRIGRYANALKISCLLIKYECYVADDNYLHGEAAIDGISLIPLLRYLEKNGLDYKFHQMIEKILEERMIENKVDQKYLDLLETKGVAFREFDGRGIKTIVDMFGKDILYLNKLYRIKDDPNF